MYGESKRAAPAESERGEEMRGGKETSSSILAQARHSNNKPPLALRIQSRRRRITISTHLPHKRQHMARNPPLRKTCTGIGVQVLPLPLEALEF